MMPERVPWDVVFSALRAEAEPLGWRIRTTWLDSLDPTVAMALWPCLPLDKENPGWRLVPFAWRS